MVIGHGCRRWWTAIALALQVIAARPVHAQCDATVLCPADPCTITGLHDLGGNCILAFTGKTVTVDGAATLRTDDLGSLTIEAKNLTLAGTITGKGGSVRLDIDNDFSMPVLGSLIDTQSANPGEWGDVDITAGNVATLRRIFTDGVDYGGDIWVEAKSMSVVGRCGPTAGWRAASSDSTRSGTPTASAATSPSPATSPRTRPVPRRQTAARST
jgi:hypothetical protein